MGVAAACCCVADPCAVNQPPVLIDDCCDERPDRLRIELLYKHEQYGKINQTVIDACCPPPAFCSGECVGLRWAGDETTDTTTTMAVKVDIDLATGDVDYVQNSAACVTSYACNWSCGTDCMYEDCPCEATLYGSADDAAIPCPQVKVLHNDTDQAITYACSGETVNPGDCIVEVETKITRNNLVYQLQDGGSCGEPSQGGGGPFDGLWSWNSEATVRYHIYQRDGVCEISEIPASVKIFWGRPLTIYASLNQNGIKANYVLSRFGGSWQDKYGRPDGCGNYLDYGDNNRLPGGICQTQCIRNNFPNSTWTLDFDIEGSNQNTGACSDNEGNFRTTRRWGEFEASTTFISSARFI